VKTRCERCGIGYSGRHVGETCNDRSGAIRRAVKEGHDVIVPCRGLLVRPEEFRFYNNRDKTSPK
jgi:hypothetical protein